MLLIKDGYVMDPCSGREEVTDVLIEEQFIKKIGHVNPDEISEDCEIIDATGMIVAPGLVDVHVHFREPGFTDKEDIDTGSDAALRGGFTSVVLMANTKPTVDNMDTLEYVMTRMYEQPLHVYTCGNVTMGMKGKKLVDMFEMLKYGAVGFSDDGVPVMDEGLIRQALVASAKYQFPISLHEENPQYIKNNGINQGKASDYFNVEGSPREAEISLIDRDLKLALETGGVLDIQHISTREGVEIVRKAKQQPNSVGIHAQATPHHFSLTEDALIKYGTMAKMNPPLRTEDDRQAIIEGLKDGTIDIIATDHAPHTEKEKKVDITKAPSGIIGLETSLSLGITNLVEPGYLSMRELLALMTYKPADVYHLPAGRLIENGHADIVVFSPDEEWVVGDYASKSSNSPFTGDVLKGIVHYSIVDGFVCYEDV